MPVESLNNQIGFNDLIKKIMDMDQPEIVRLHSTLGAMLGVQQPVFGTATPAPSMPIPVSSPDYQDPEEEEIDLLRVRLTEISKTMTPYEQVKWVDQVSQEVSLVECFDMLEAHRRETLSSHPAVAVRVTVTSFASHAPGMFALGAAGILLAVGSFGFWLFHRIF